MTEGIKILCFINKTIKIKFIVYFSNASSPLNLFLFASKTGNISAVPF
jgi:hypothetical protein